MVQSSSLLKFNSDFSLVRNFICACALGISFSFIFSPGSESRLFIDKVEMAASSPLEAHKEFVVVDGSSDYVIIVLRITKTLKLKSCAQFVFNTSAKRAIKPT